MAIKYDEAREFSLSNVVGIKKPKIIDNSEPIVLDWVYWLHKTIFWNIMCNQPQKIVNRISLTNSDWLKDAGVFSSYVLKMDK